MFDLLDLRVRPDRLVQMFPVQSVIEEPGGVRVNVEVSSLWQLRCIVGHLNGRGQVEIELFKRSCQG